ncbi:MAG TPA: FAD-dependent oxidoreductase, partial [Candidatus Omnitrophota bacterium]|nr:FAD-dependent oxidoreductase [Candidatus Omnitrophota bacterium]
QLDSPKAPKRVRTTKGIHIVYKGEISKHALLLGSQSDRRVFFVIPWMGNSLIGTTDTDYDGSPDDVKVEPEDLEYLMRESRRVFPALDFGEGRILATFAGLRPLISKGGAASKVSRKHLFYQSSSGVFFVVGGKYTTYRKVAEDCVKKIWRPFGREGFKVYGSGPILGSAEAVGAHYDVEPKIVQSLMDLYGTHYRDVLHLTELDANLKEKVSIDPIVIKAQLVYSVQTEMARTVEDIADRRLSLFSRGPVPEVTLAAIRSCLK